MHRPPQAGTHGRVKDGAFSILISHGSATSPNVDCGEQLVYVGVGGCTYHQNRRKGEQCRDQELTRNNLALALNCNAPINSVKGSVINGEEWRDGKPIRVVSPIIWSVIASMGYLASEYEVGTSMHNIIARATLRWQAYSHTG